MHDDLLPKLKTSDSKSKFSVKNILESADSIFDEGNSADFTARNLSERSGYSVGAIYHHFQKAEHAFILMLFSRRERRLNQLIDIINQFPEDRPLNHLIELLVDTAFSELNRLNRKTFILIARMAIKFSKDHLSFDNSLSILADPYIAARERNTTGTFRHIEHDDLIMLFRLCAISLRQPFLTQDPIAGTQKHRDFVVDTMMRLFWNQT